MAFVSECLDTLFRDRLNKRLELRYEFNVYERDAMQPWPEGAPKIEPFVPFWSLDKDRPQRVRVLRTTEALDHYWTIYSDDEHLSRCYSGKLREPVAITLARYGYYRRPVCAVYERGRRSVGAKITLDMAFQRKGVGQ